MYHDDYGIQSLEVGEETTLPPETDPDNECRYKCTALVECECGNAVKVFAHTEDWSPEKIDGLYRHRGFGTVSTGQCDQCKRIIMQDEHGAFSLKPLDQTEGKGRDLQAAEVLDV